MSPAAHSDLVSFRTDDGIELSGRLFGPRHAEAGIVLAHGATVDQSSWLAFAEELGRRGYLVLTFDFLVLLATRHHSAEMLGGSRSEEARAAVFDWLEQYLPV